MGFNATKKCFLFIVLLVCVIIGMFIYINSSFTRSVILSTSTSLANMSVSNTDTPPSPEEQFRLMLGEYNDHIRRIEKPVYQEHRHVQYGPPIPTDVASGLGTDVKLILLWTEFFGIKQWTPELMCSGQNKTCVTSMDKNDILKSQGVLIHARDISSLPNDRLPSQRWIYFIQESPYATGLNIGKYNSVFNWTSTYRLDSDLPAYYYKSSPLKNPLSNLEYRKQFTRIMATKKKQLMGAISNCDQTHTSRITFIHELKKHMKVDVYGSCGDVECSKESSNCTEVFTQYKFFLSFENTNCRDYITEKVSNPLHVFNSVPIVMGASHPDEYVRIMPPNSFIHYQGFASAKELAKFLIYLDNNDDVYELYHLWRRTHEKASGDLWCDMCKALHNTSLPAKVYTDFEGWYAQDTCHANSILSILSTVIGVTVIVIILINLRYAGVF